MNILCKIFGHNMYLNTENLCGGSTCNRRWCGHTDDGIEWPKVEPPRYCIHESVYQYDYLWTGGAPPYRYYRDTWWDFTYSDGTTETVVKREQLSNES